MLLAELHGKRCEAAESSEDFLTSAVFGHLRQVTDGRFWRAVFTRSCSVGLLKTSLQEQLELAGINIATSCDLRVLFWPNAGRYGEPDILMRIRTDSGHSLIVLIEVKLNSEKSSVGSKDQLSVYFDLLHDKRLLCDLLQEDLPDDPFVALIYLTERFSADEVNQSIRCSGQVLAGTRMFPLQWQDMLEAAREINPAPDSILGEVLRFLEGRGFERFRRFHDCEGTWTKNLGRFYSAAYFRMIPALLERPEPVIGGFYEH